MFVDFDGTLSEIVERPELARPVPGAGEALSALARSFALVAVVSGRPGAFVRSLLPVPGLEVFGLYGLERSGLPAGRSVRAVRAEVQAIARLVEGAWVEDKGASLAVHYRAASDPDRAGATIAGAAAELARSHGLRMLPGKMVVELAPAELPGKGVVVAEAVRSRRLEGALYAGDDLADLEAFAALEDLRQDGITTVRVVVRTEETPEALGQAADVAVHRPAGLVALLADLARLDPGGASGGGTGPG